MTNYEQKLIADLRRQQGRVIGRIEKRLDRANSRHDDLTQTIVKMMIRLQKAEQLLVAAFLDRDGPPPPPPE